MKRLVHKVSSWKRSLKFQVSSLKQLLTCHFQLPTSNFQLDTSGKSGPCKRIRLRLADSAYHRLGPGAAWVQRHVAQCPRCQKRLAAFGKVNLALSLVKSQPHRLDLLRRANSAAVHMLNHQLQEEAEARRLEHAQPQPCFAERCARHQSAITNVAACLAILILTKAGIFSSFYKVNAHSQTALKHYYADRAGEDLAGEVFQS